MNTEEDEFARIEREQAMRKGAATQALEALDISQGILAGVKSHHQPKVLEAYTVLQAALATQPAQQEPVNEGWKLVPVEPTEDMWKAMNLALVALETERDNYQDWDKEDGAPEYIYEAITALQDALATQPAQPAQQEPVAWRVKVETKLRDGSVDVGYQLRNERLSKYDEPLYTSPPAQPAQPGFQALQEAHTRLQKRCGELEAQRKPMDVASAIEYADSRWAGVDVPIEWCRHFADALQPAQQEPVAEVAGRCGDLHIKFLNAGLSLNLGDKLYTTPPAQRTWVGLTDEEIVAKALHLSGLGTSPDVIQFARAIEAQLKENNT